MKHYIKSITWKFMDSSEHYPQLKDKRIKIACPKDLFDAFQFLFEGAVKEKFVVFWLSSSNEITGFEVITEGLLNSSLAHSREVFRGAIVASCANIILAHNHPSGNLEPSSEDINITRKIISAGKIIDINVFDHVIFSDSGYTSFVEKHLF